MKTLIFSDTHLTHRFDQKKFNYLKNLFNSVDEIIINGDFWDGLSTSFDRFLNSPWQALFPILKAKQAIYIYGNHDFAYMSDKRVSLFSVKQAEEHFAFTNPKKLVIRHGHQHTPSIQDKFKNRRLLKTINDLYDPAENWALKIFGKKFFQKSLYAKFNALLLNFAQHELKSNEILVCGHSHNAVFTPEQKFINSGFIRHKLAQYLLIEDKKIKAIEERY